MKQVLPVVISLFIGACGSSDGNDEPDKGNSSGGGGTYQFSMSTQNMNLCGQTSEYTNYEVIAYSDDGGIISRHQPNISGQVQATFELSHVNLAIVRDTGTDTSDKKDLNVTVLAHYPIGDLGTLTLRTDDTEGCRCQTATISILSGDLTTQKLNLPYSGFLATPEPNRRSQFSNTRLCEVEEGVEALLVANHLDTDSGDIYYRAIADTSQLLTDGALSIDMLNTGQIGRSITINTEDHGSRTHWINYVTDQVYDYSVPDNFDENIHVLDHERIEKIAFHASEQLDVLGHSTPVRSWDVHVPVTDDTTDITYSKPEFEADLLSNLLDDPTSAYNLDGTLQRVVTGYVEFSRPDNTTDEWFYILPSQSDSGFNFELPPEYLEGLAEDSLYQDLTSYSYWRLNQIPAIGSLDEFYQFDWLKVLLPTKSPVRIRPPAAYSYVSLVEE